jgi:phosphatidate cytidylyltransferase
MNNLQKRIFTSLILAIILLICIFLNKYSFLILVIIASIVSFYEFHNLTNIIWKKNKNETINIICFFYLFFFTYSAYELYKEGLNITIFILLICIFSDIGGYVIGKAIGGKKLTKISPNKTVSGSIGSFIFSLIPIIIFFFDI